jgi:hypothetical protein
MSDGDAASPSAPDGHAMTSAPATPADGGSSSDGSAPPTSAPTPITFSYAPGFQGVVTVDVLGGFGAATDWTVPIASLTPQSDGTFTGTTPPLPPGGYTYLFRVIGDAAAAPAAQAKMLRYALDPSASVADCPASAPTFDAKVNNPCSVLVGAGSGAPLAHVRGLVVSGGKPIADFLVMIEREETGSHHTFVNRTNTGTDGAYELAVAPGTYRLSVLHPSFLAKNDAQRTNPEALGAARRTLSSPITVTADMELNAAEVAWDDYATMTPTGSAALPTTFTFAGPAGTKTRAAVYGPGKSVGDPLWVSELTTETSVEFDGGLTPKATGTAVVDAGAQYWWGTERQYPKPTGGVVWTAQSMVFPIQWP